MPAASADLAADPLAERNCVHEAVKAGAVGGSGGRPADSPQTLIRLPPGSRLVLGDVEIEAMGSGDSGGAGTAGMQGAAGTVPTPAFPSVPPNSPNPAGGTGFAAVPPLPPCPMFAPQPPFPGWVDPAAMAAAAAEFAALQHQQAAAAAAWAAGGMPMLAPDAAAAAAAGMPLLGYEQVGMVPAAPMPAASYTSAHSPAAAAAAAAAPAGAPAAQHAAPAPQQAQPQPQPHPLRRPSSHQLPCMPNLGSAAALDPATLAVEALGDAASGLPLGDAGGMAMQQGAAASRFAPQAAAAGGGSGPACGPHGIGAGMLLTSSTLSMERDLDLLAHGRDMEG